MTDSPPPALPDPEQTQSTQLAAPRPLPRPRPRPAPAPAPASGRAWERGLALLGAVALAVALFWSYRSVASVRRADERTAALQAALEEVRAGRMAAEERVSRAERERDASRAEQRRGTLPRANATLVELGPARAANGGRAPETEVPLAADGPPAILRLDLGSRPLEASFAVEIHDARGLLLWRGDRLRREPGDRFVVVLPGGSLATGRHEIHLLGARGGVERRLASWTIQVVSGS